MTKRAVLFTLVGAASMLSAAVVAAADTQQQLRLVGGGSTTPDDTSASTLLFLRQLRLDDVGDRYDLEECQGDCDRSSDCRGNLKCYQRRSRDDDPIPGCRGDPSDFGSTDFCYDPDKKDSTEDEDEDYGGSDWLRKRGNNWRPSRAFKLGQCEGDCDGDYDCEGPLVCHQRDGRSRVPSCYGRGVSGMDYCIHPDDETDDEPPVHGAFRLKMFWEYGYDWQEKFWEEEWCMECRGRSGGRSCRDGDAIVVGPCDDQSAWFLLKDRDDDEYQIEIAETDLCLHLEEEVDLDDYNDDGVSGDDAIDSYITARECSSSSERQRFEADKGDFDDPKFEIHTKEKKGCLTTMHHPKNQEAVKRQRCFRPQKVDTSYWQKY